MTPERFKVHSEGFTIPWATVAPFEDWAQRNHGQTLLRLHERGGLSPRELYAVMHRKPWREVRSIDGAMALEWAKGLR